MFESNILAMGDNTYECVPFFFVNSVEPSSASMKARAYHSNVTLSTSINGWEN